MQLPTMSEGRAAMVLSTAQAALRAQEKLPLLGDIPVHTGLMLGFDLTDVIEKKFGYQLVGSTWVYRESREVKQRMMFRQLGIYDDTYQKASDVWRVMLEIGRVFVMCRNGSLFLVCRVPSVDDYELPGSRYSLECDQLWWEIPGDSTRITASKLADAIVEFCKRVVLFVQVFGDAVDVAKRSAALLDTHKTAFSRKYAEAARRERERKARGVV